MHVNRPWRVDTRGVRVSLLRCDKRAGRSSLTNAGTHALRGCSTRSPSVLCRSAAAAVRLSRSSQGVAIRYPFYVIISKGCENT